MKLDRVLREILEMEKVHSFATLSEVIEATSASASEGIRGSCRGRMRLNGRQRGRVGWGLRARMTTTNIQVSWRKRRCVEAAMGSRCRSKFVDLAVVEVVRVIQVKAGPKARGTVKAW